MKLQWIIARNNDKALLNVDQLEVEIRKLEKGLEPKVQVLSKRFTSQCGFIKIVSGNIYDCVITTNNISHILDEMSLETAAKFIPKLFSSLGDIYEEK